MRKSFILACFFMLAGLLIVAGPTAYGQKMTGNCTNHGSDHGCTGYGGMKWHPEFNDHCAHEAGSYAYPGSQDCCDDAGWIATNPPPPPSSGGSVSNAGIASARNDTETASRLVSTKPRAIGRSINATIGTE